MRQKLRVSKCARCRTKIGLSSRRSASICQGLSSCLRVRRHHNFSLMIGKAKRSLTVVIDGTSFYGRQINLTQATLFPISATVLSCDRLQQNEGLQRDIETRHFFSSNVRPRIVKRQAGSGCIRMQATRVQNIISFACEKPERRGGPRVGLGATLLRNAWAVCATRQRVSLRQSPRKTVHWYES